MIDFVHMTKNFEVVKSFPDLEAAKKGKPKKGIVFLGSVSNEGIRALFKWDEKKKEWRAIAGFLCGGIRKGAGRPKGTKGEVYKRSRYEEPFATTLPVDLLEWLQEMREKGNRKNFLVAQGLRLLKARIEAGEGFPFPE